MGNVCLKQSKMMLQSIAIFKLDNVCLRQSKLMIQSIADTGRFLFSKYLEKGPLTRLHLQCQQFQ